MSKGVFAQNFNTLNNGFGIDFSFSQYIYPDELSFQEISSSTFEYTNHIIYYFLKIAKKISKMIHKMTSTDLEAMPIIKIDNEVKKLLNTDVILQNFMSNFTNDIYTSSSAFAMEVEQIEINKKSSRDYYNHEDIITRIKVSKDKNINEIDKFWNYIGRTLSRDLDELNELCPEKAKKLNETLLVIVSK